MAASGGSELLIAAAWDEVRSRDGLICSSQLQTEMLQRPNKVDN